MFRLRLSVFIQCKTVLLLCSFINHRFSGSVCCFNVVVSIEQTFNNCLTSLSDFKELIPEFYESNGEFLQNVHRINFGTRQDGLAVNDVELPPWAKCKQAISDILFL